MPYCCILECKNESRHINLKNNGVSYHRFPKDPDIKEKWIEATGRVNWMPTKYSVLCSDHFDGDCLTFSKKGIRFMKPTAIPTLKIMKFLNDKENSDHVSAGCKKRQDDSSLCPPPNESLENTNYAEGTISVNVKVEKINHINSVHAHSSDTESIYNMNPSERKLKGRLRYCENKIVKQGIKIKRLQAKNRGLIRKINRMDEIRDEILKLFEEKLSMSKKDLECLKTTI